MAVCLIGMVLVVGQTTVAATAVYWLLLELIVVTVQDRFIFPLTFANYIDYRRMTPFLIPSLASLSKLAHIPIAVKHDRL